MNKEIYNEFQSPDILPVIKYKDWNDFGLLCEWMCKKSNEVFGRQTRRWGRRKT
jgi:hypothetical protein